MEANGTSVRSRTQKLYDKAKANPWKTAMYAGLVVGLVMIIAATQYPKVKGMMRPSGKTLYNRRFYY